MSTNPTASGICAITGANGFLGSLLVKTLEDLGWMTNPVRAREQQIAGHWERAQMIATFSALTGQPVDEAALTWWNVFANWKLAAIVLSGVHAFVGGELDRIYHAPSFLYQHMFELMHD